MDSPRRIPRPLGITYLALSGDRKKLYSTLSRRYLQGEFPYKENLSMSDFCIRYKIPLKIVQSIIKEGLQESSIFEGEDLYAKLDNIRFRLLDNTIYQYGETAAKNHRLVTYLEDRVYSSTRTDPSVIKELNTALSNNHKGIDSASKVLSLLNDALSSVDPSTINNEKALSRNEILQALVDLKPNMSLMASEVKETPSLNPTGTAGGVSLVPLKKVDGNYVKAQNIENPFIPSEILTLPV